MVEEMGGAGTRTVKMRGGMGLLGVIGKYGMYRLNNSLALLDAKIRGVGPEQARAGRNWSNYTWHGDQAPGHPWVHGLQASECDFNDLRFSKLIVMDGKNLVENKLTDSHWFIECMERGAKIVVIAPEYGPPSTKADYWIPIRPQTDAALWLGITKLMIDKDKIKMGWRRKERTRDEREQPTNGRFSPNPNALMKAKQAYQHQLDDNMNGKQQMEKNNGEGVSSLNSFAINNWV